MANVEDDRLNWIVRLLAANLIVLIILGVGLIFALLPKVERAVQVSERVEGRFQEFADKVQPVLESGAGKAVETIRKMDADRMSETATESTNSVMEAAAEKAKKLLKRGGSDQD